MQHNSDVVDRDYFAANKNKLEYVRAPMPNEFEDVVVPAEARVRVYRINQRSRVKVLESPTGERLATVIATDGRAPSGQQAA